MRETAQSALGGRGVRRTVAQAAPGWQRLWCRLLQGHCSGAGRRPVTSGRWAPSLGHFASLGRRSPWQPAPLCWSTGG